VQRDLSAEHRQAGLADLRFDDVVAGAHAAARERKRMLA
jgi:hypothetical protein